MGLDVNLYKYALARQKVVERQREAYSAAQHELWLLARSDDDLAPEELAKLKSAESALQQAMAVDDDGYPVGQQPVKIDQASATHPEHLFRVGYFRSSYNASGFNRVIAIRTGGADLYTIFQPPADQHAFVPEWAAAASRCAEMQQAWAESLAQHGCYRVLTVSRDADEVRHIRSEAEALARFNAESGKYQPSTLPTYWDMSIFASRVGHFFLAPDRPLPVAAVIPGTAPSYLRDEAARPCTYVVYEDENMPWYTAALAIVQETIQYVLATGEPHQYALHWNG